jgi:hypothetical protein
LLLLRSTASQWELVATYFLALSLKTLMQLAWAETQESAVLTDNTK